MDQEICYPSTPYFSGMLFPRLAFLPKNKFYQASLADLILPSEVNVFSGLCVVPPCIWFLSWQKVQATHFP